VLNHATYCGWVIRDLDVLLSPGVGEARLRQLTRLRHGQGQVARLGHKAFRVMGTLHLKVANQRQLLSEAEWRKFAEEVRTLRRMGVTAISTDLWWGLIEGRQAGQFDWSYYDRVLALLAQHDMQWVPILSFHQAGGNVNDDFMQTIPLWLWGKLLESHPELGSVRGLHKIVVHVATGLVERQDRHPLHIVLGQQGQHAIVIAPVKLTGLTPLNEPPPEIGGDGRDPHAP
jgi:hypothetical protein